jgi:hypothetical protein
MATSTPTKPRSPRRSRADRAAELAERDRQAAQQPASAPEPAPAPEPKPVVTVEFVVMATAPKVTVGAGEAAQVHTCPHPQGHLSESGRQACAAKLARDAGVELPA